MVSKILIKWYENIARDLPWRQTNDPYKIWVSEIILQQTRVNQSIGYYNNFISEFPTIQKLASSNIDHLMNVWQGLGYYSRARNMHKAANSIVEMYNGVFPSEYNELIKLKGVGQYTAAAVASIAFNKPYAVVDGNVYRVLSRLYGIDIPINTSKAKNYFYEKANQILDHENPGKHNQAIMELGALICLPQSPQCYICPLSNYCIAFNNNMVGKLPLRIKKNKIKERYLYYIVLRKDNKTFIKQRPVGDIWAMLYEFPIIETESKVDVEKLKELDDWHKLFKEGECEIISITDEYKHKLTHRLLYIRFIEINVKKSYSLPGFIEIDFSELKEYAFPVVIIKYLALNFNFGKGTYNKVVC